MGTLPVESAPTVWISSAKRKLGGEGPAWTDYRETKRRQIIPDSLLDGFSKLQVLSPRQLDDLPQEILLNIFQHFAEPWVLTDDLADWDVYTLDGESKIRQKTLVALTQTCRRLNEAATSILYRCAHIPSSRSFTRFLSSLCVQPSLSELVKQLSCDFLVTISRHPQILRSDPAPLNAEPLGSGSQQTGPSRPIGRALQTSNPNNKSVANGHVLDSVLKHIPAIRALSISSVHPWTRIFPVSMLPLEHLSKLRISTVQPLRLYLSSYNARNEPAVIWLNKSNLGRYPALKQVELVHPEGKWTASLVTVEAANGSGPPVMEKYVTSLTTCWRDSLRAARWELLSLGQDIFAAEHLHTLEYGPQRQKWGFFPHSRQLPGWDLNRFLATTGRRIRSLSLDWETTSTPLVQLGPTGTLTTLPMLTCLTHLTVSMQVLFQQAVTFQDQLESILTDPEAELARLLPASLRVLRLSEFVLGVISPENQFFEDYNVAGYNFLLLSFIEVLRAYWLDARRGRELWFRHCVELEYHPRLADVPSRCQLRWLVSSQRRGDVGRQFARVYPMLPGNAARYRDETAASHAS
ncbi:hypothetical protein KVR01_005251 [Diaporthe batatas]|uniref:uncharacterized protein n=1 Tax=Diaporthe batatas TaxID=748121 RepID=UPI001D04F109|nr:uncharacterized protein KVR01_005251 [Diaporthe batatas]KAG8164976.1 hypothetical protein KVR01_005251 [Diaporthe batatas]